MGYHGGSNGFQVKNGIAPSEGGASRYFPNFSNQESEQPLSQVSGNSQIFVGDCVEEMAKMPADSVDSIVTDPPYGLEFMGKEWDKLRWNGEPHGENNQRPTDEKGRSTGLSRLNVPRPRYGSEPQMMQAWHETWAREALRILKPGGFAVIAGGTRTFHRLVCALEDAGFEIRDTIAHIYGSGFPKSLDVSKAIDKMAGAEREVVGKSARHVSGKPNQRTEGLNGSSTFAETVGMGQYVTAPATEAAQQWQGFGTALKPAFEPWTLARKPLSEKNVAQNVLKHGTGAINVDGSRVGTGESIASHHGGARARDARDFFGMQTGQYKPGDAGQHNTQMQGRWPPNLLLSHHPDCKPTGEVRRVKNPAGHGRPAKREANGTGMWGMPGDGHRYGDPDGTEPQEVWECVAGCPVAEMDRQSGTLKSGALKRGQYENGITHNVYGEMKGWESPEIKADAGGASRFFPRFEGEAPFRYVAKASRRERNAGLEGMPEKLAGVGDERPGGSMHERAGDGGKVYRQNPHPTVKPIALMRWLVRLVCPPGGTVLDPFAGSGSTGCAAVLEGVNFIGIEMHAEYAEIAHRRIAYWSLPEYDRPKAQPTKPEAEQEDANEQEDSWSGTLF